MFGNGQQQPSSRSMWGDMFGLGPLFKMISDPGLQSHAHAMMGAIIEGASASARIEAKLDALLRAQGDDPAKYADAAPRRPVIFTPPVLTLDRADGAGRPAPASGAVDDGVGADSPDFDAALFPTVTPGDS